MFLYGIFNLILFVVYSLYSVTCIWQEKPKEFSGTPFLPVFGVYYWSHVSDVWLVFYKPYFVSISENMYKNIK